MPPYNNALYYSDCSLTIQFLTIMKGCILQSIADCSNSRNYVSRCNSWIRFTITSPLHTKQIGNTSVTVDSDQFVLAKDYEMTDERRRALSTSQPYLIEIMSYSIVIVHYCNNS